MKSSCGLGEEEIDENSLSEAIEALKNLDGLDIKHKIALNNASVSLRRIMGKLAREREKSKNLVKNIINILSLPHGNTVFNVVIKDGKITIPFLSKTLEKKMKGINFLSYIKNNIGEKEFIKLLEKKRSSGVNEIESIGLTFNIGGEIFVVGVVINENKEKLIFSDQKVEDLGIEKEIQSYKENSKDDFVYGIYLIPMSCLNSNPSLYLQKKTIFGLFFTIQDQFITN